MRQLNHVKALLLTGCAAGSLLVGATAMAAEGFSLNMERQNLGAALNELALKTGHQIAFSPENTRSKIAPALRGQIDLHTALARLLVGTNLSYRTARDGTILIVPATEPVARFERTAAASPPPAAPQQIAQLEASPEPSAITEVVVTASRVQRAGFEAPTPMTVVGAQELQSRATTTVAETLNELPIFRPTNISTTSVGFNGIARQTGQATVDLRGLGNLRTLVLVNGRRHVPTHPNGTLDLGLIPTTMIARTEVVTGGASAQWGSDAVAGVLNLILDTNLRGARFDVSYGNVFDQGDLAEYKLSGAVGGGFANDRGHFLVGGEYVNQTNNGYTLSRDYLRRETGSSTYPGTSRPLGQANVIVADQTRQYSPFGGHIVGVNADANPANGVDVLRNIQFGPGGVVQPYNPGQEFGSNTVGGAEPFQAQRAFLRTPVERYSALANLRYEFSPALVVGIEGGTAQSESVVNSPLPLTLAAATAAIDYILIRRDNAFLPESIRTIMTANNIPSFYLARWSDDIGNPSLLMRNTTHRFVLSANGEINSNWRWDAYYQLGQNKYLQSYRGLMMEPQLQRAYDAVRDSAGQIVCRVNQTTVTDSRCVPANLIGTGNLSAAAKDYITGTSFYRMDYTQQVAAVNLRGDLFNTWAGPVSTAFGAEYRQERAQADSDEISTAGLFDYGNTAPFKGKYSVKEAFAEVVVPLAKDQAFARSLEFNGAARRTTYTQAGSVTTWKVGLTYEPWSELRFRGTRSRDIRAPNMNELFGRSEATAAVINRYTNILTRPPGISVGNPELTPEIANTLTFGGVYQPNWLRGFRASVDYYDIDIKDVMTVFGAQVIVDNCYAELGPTGQGAPGQFCRYVISTGTPGVSTGPNAYSISATLLPAFNQARQQVKGLDFEAGYTRPMLGGSIDLRAFATKTIELSLTNNLGKTDSVGWLTNRADGVPRWLMTLFATYQRGPASITLQGRYIDSVGINGQQIGPDDGRFQGLVNDPARPALANTTVNINRLDSRWYFALSGSYTLLNRAGGRKLDLYGAVNNLFNTEPPYPNGGTNYYDRFGRAYKIGLRASF